MPNKSMHFNLEDLKDLIYLPKGKAGMYQEACVWCLDKHGHQNGIELELLYEKKKILHPVYWSDEKIEIERVRKHYNIDDALPFGSEAMAFFICAYHTNFNNFQRSIKKTGIDYWLGTKGEDPNLPFQNSGRLEISGILTESDTNTVEKRIKEKLKQSSQSDRTTLPVYVVVVAFDRPYAKMVIKNVDS